MSLAVASNFSSSLVALPSPAYVMPFALAESSSDLSLEITIPELAFRFTGSVGNVSKLMAADSQSGFVFEVPLHEGVNLVLTLSGSMNREDTSTTEEDTFTTEEVNVNIDSQDQDAEACFVASSFYAAVGMGERVRILIPELGLDLSQAFQTTLSAISEKLQWRQIAYRVMVVERATGFKFELPSALSGIDVEHLAFIYYAVVERTFLFPFSTVTYPALPATKSNLEQITNLSSKKFIVVGPDSLNKSFLGKTIPLGNDAVFIIADAVIDNFEQVREELARDDGHSVEIVIRSLSGQAEYRLPSAPRMPNTAWEPFIQKLVDIDAVLDARLAERYHTLAAATLSGLSDAEKEIATVRPDLPIEMNPPL